MRKQKKILRTVGEMMIQYTKIILQSQSLFTK